jgi:photosystem II stability/assembly factor-like uncharacterized protein
MKKPLLKSIAIKLISGIGILALFPLGAGAQWVQTNGPTTGGAVQALAVNGDYVFAGTASGGVFVTSDSGNNWNATNFGLTSSNVYTFAVSDDNIFAGTRNGGVFHSTDKGVSWSAVNNGLTNLTTFTLALHDRVLFAGTDGGGIFRSTDSGTSWTVVNSGLTSLKIASLLVINSNVFAGTGDQQVGSTSSCPSNTSRSVCRSIDNGASWITVGSGLPTTCLYASPIWFWYSFEAHSLASVNDFIFCAHTSNNFGIYKSANNGISWNAINSGLSGKNVLSLFANGSDLYAGISGGGVFRSTDSGTNWAAFNTGLTDMNIRSFTVGEGYLFAGTNTSGVWRLYVGETSVKNPQNYLPEQFTFNLFTRNQSNATISISFSLPRFSPVQLKIYNLSGHLIATLYDKPMTAGAHTLMWDTRNVAAGCYMLRMQAGATTQVKAVPLFR